MDKSMKILIVADRRPDLDELLELLNSDSGIETASNERQALKAASASPPPNLILLGLMKTESERFDLCRRLKDNPTTRDIPLILLVSATDSDIIARGLALGAADCITRSISPQLLMARIKIHLALCTKEVELRRAYRQIEDLKKGSGMEFTVGRKIQESIVPSIFPAFPDHDEFDIYAVLQPAREFEGNFYDFFFIGEDRLCFCIGDVTGKGLQAALFMSVAKTIIKSRAGDDFSTASILTHVNEELKALKQASMFMSLFIGILNIKTGRLLYTNAGHKPPYLKKGTGSIKRLDRIHGPQIGIAGGVVYRENFTTLSKNDMLMLYTDGLMQDGGDEKKRFSDKRLEELLDSIDYDSAEDIVKAAIAEKEKTHGKADPMKDMTVLAVKFLRTPEETAGPRLELSIPNHLAESAGVKDHFDTFAENYGIPDKTRLKMHVVIDELLTNIISYAYPDDDPHEIGIKIELSANRLKVSMVDDGIPFNPLGLETPDTELSLEERQIGGLGIHIVRKMMDRVSYRRRIDKNVITAVEFLNKEKQN
jgi:sigma-B regulation protein RsbU (phosphoserine phosphatase)